jgi:hypothetical protein
MIFYFKDIMIMFMNDVMYNSIKKIKCSELKNDAL